MVCLACLAEQFNQSLKNASLPINLESLTFDGRLVQPYFIRAILAQVLFHPSLEAMPEVSTQSDLGLDDLSDIEKRCYIQSIVLKQGFSSPKLVEVIECVGVGTSRKFSETAEMRDAMALGDTLFVEANVHFEDDEGCDYSGHHQLPTTMSLRSLMDFAELMSERKPVVNFALCYYPKTSDEKGSVHITCVYDD